MISSGTGFQFQNRQLLSTSSSAMVNGRSQIRQKARLLLFGIPRGGSSDIVLDLLATDDDDEDDEEEENDDDDEDGDDATSSTVTMSEEMNKEIQPSADNDEQEDQTDPVTEQDDDDDEEEEEVEVEEESNDNNHVNQDGEEEDEDDEDVKPSAAVSSQPISIVFKTNMGNHLIDTSLELLVSRSRTVENVKQTLSRMLPGRPPVEVMRLLCDGILLEDDQVINDVIDDDDDDDDDDQGEGSSSSVTVILDMVPPVDSKFGTTQLHKMNDMSTSDLLDAYVTNAAAMYHQSNMVGQLQNMDEETPPSTTTATTSELLSLQLQQKALEIREQLVQSFPEKTHGLISTEPPSVDHVEERRGQRYRTSKGGAKTNLRRIIQTNLNINWSVTIRNCVLFLFFGLFGGRNTISRNLLLLGAPLCFLLQARVIKMYLKLLFYACAHPPSILLSLLPAPQQAILSFDPDQVQKILYPKHQDMEDETRLKSQ